MVRPDDVDHDRDGGGDDGDHDRGNGGDDDVETVGRRRRVSWRGHLRDCTAPVRKMSVSSILSTNQLSTSTYPSCSSCSSAGSFSAGSTADVLPAFEAVFVTRLHY